MKLKEPDNETAAAFGREFIEHLAPYSMDTIPKRELDRLIFHLLKEHGLIPGATNREMAYSLNIKEKKFTAYLEDAHSKYGKHDREESVRQIFDKLKKGGLGVSLEKDTLILLEDDPVVRADFVEDMKSAGLCPDSGINTELVKVKAVSFLLYALEKGRLDEEKALEILNKDKPEHDRIRTIVNANKSPKDIMGDMLGILKRQENFGIKTVVDLLDYSVDIATAKLGRNKDK